jgi:hypothetical protein
MRKNRRKHKPRFKCYRCVVYYLDGEDSINAPLRSLHFAVHVGYYEHFLELLECTFGFWDIARLGTFYSPVNRDFYSLI